MNVLVAPNAFKESLTAGQAGQAIRVGVLEADPSATVQVLPIADGGDGLVEVGARLAGFEILEHEVTGPLGTPVRARLAVNAKTGRAIIEMAEASGLALIPEQLRDPTRTSTAGTGQLIDYALGLGAKSVLVGIGGSATNDGGVGMAIALGARFLDREGRAVADTGRHLVDIARVDLTGLRLPAGVVIEVACDVDNPLIGPNGATRTYAPQKGATPQQIELLEAGMVNLAQRVEEHLGINIRTLPGAGAAGGLGAGFLAFLDAKLRRGAETVLDLVGFDQAMTTADLVITGEGHLDAQSAFGKAPCAVAARCLAAGKPCIAIAGRVSGEQDTWSALGFTSAVAATPADMPLAMAFAQAPDLVQVAARKAVASYLAGENH